MAWAMDQELVGIEPGPAKRQRLTEHVEGLDLQLDLFPLRQDLAAADRPHDQSVQVVVDGPYQLFAADHAVVVYVEPEHQAAVLGGPEIVGVAAVEEGIDP